MKYGVRLLIISIVFLLTGCMFAVPVIQGFKDIGLTENDRIELLKNELKQFHFAIKDGNRMRAYAYSTEEFQEEFKNLLRKSSREEKIFETKVDFVDVKDGAKEAEVEVIVKYYKQPYYIVQERLVAEMWTFGTSSGWKLSKYEVVTEDLNKK